MCRRLPQGQSDGVRVEELAEVIRILPDVFQTYRIQNTRSLDNNTKIEELRFSGSHRIIVIYSVIQVNNAHNSKRKLLPSRFTESKTPEKITYFRGAGRAALAIVRFRRKQGEGESA
nr:hypothetical protein Iba_chr05eCG12790 [Ipomoea batatas]